MRSTKKDTLGKNAIWSVIEKNLFRQRVFLMCATNREHVSTLNEGAYRPRESGINPEMLTDVTGPTQVFRIASGDMTPDDYAKADAAIYQKGPPTGSTTTRFNKDKRYKAQWIEPMVSIYELEPEASYNCFWFPVCPDSVDFLCEHCRAANSMDEIEIAQFRPTTCINCSANTQDHYKKSAPTLGARKSVLVLAARLKVAFKNCGLDKLDIGKGFQKWLVFAAASVISNAQLKYGEELMKSLSHMGGVRVPPNQAREIFKNGRGKQFSVYRERIRDKKSQKWILAFRVTKDCGNVAYKDFFEQVAVPEIQQRNEIFAFSRASAEKVGDIIEFWLGVLDIASMARGVVDVFDTKIDPAEYLNGLEKALATFGSTARTTFTTNDKRRGSFDCTLQPSEAGEVMTLINSIPDYESLGEFSCMTEWEEQCVISMFRKRYNMGDDDVNMGDTADDESGQGLPAHPEEEEAEEPKADDADAARASERSGKQHLLDVLGNVFTVSEEVNVCIFCGSTKHAHDECEDPNRADIKKALDTIRTALEGDSPGSDVEMEQEGEKRKEGSGETNESHEPVEPDETRTGDYHWYDECRLMSDVGDLDEAGRFCIEGRDIVSEGPMNRADLDEVIRDAVVRGGGDVWRVPEFLAAYTEKNARKKLYKRIEAPLDGFLKVVPNTGCYFHNYRYYSGVEFGVDYKFGHNNRMTSYEDEVSSALNRILRHQVGKASERQSLACDDAGWVSIDDVLQCEGIWRCERSRRPHTFLVPYGRSKTKDNWDEQEATFRLKTLFRVMFYSARYGRRVREQVLAFGIYPDIDRGSETCRCNNVSVATDIPPEGLLLYPVAVRAPTGHKDTTNIHDVELKSTLLSHPIAPSTVVSLPACFHITPSKHLKSIWKEGLIPGGLSGNSRIFTFFNPYVPWDPRSWRVTKSVDTRSGGFVCLYVPTETLMTEFNGRLTDSGQVVTDQVIPFSKIKGGWIQDFNTAWQRLIVPSGDDQVVRIGRIRSAVVTTKESVLRIAKQCLSAEEQPYGESTMDALNLVHKFENNLIPEGGREMYESRVALVDYILEKKAVTEAGCRYCPHCLKETPTKFAICLECWTALESYGIKPYRIIEEEDEDEATKRQIDEEVRRQNETIFKETVDEAQESAAKEYDSYGFDPNEVDYDEGDEEMNEEQEDEEIVVEKDEEDDTGDAQQAEESPKIPAWALNLDVGSRRLPVKGLINNDSSEGAAQLFDNAVVAKILGMYKYYYNQRVMMTPEEYQNKMTTSNVGRLDLDGICPYTGENDDGTLKRPSEEELDAMFKEKAKQEDWMQGEKMYGGRPRSALMPVILTLEIYEKLMESLVLAGFKPDQLQFLIPMSRMTGSAEGKNEMRAKISDFLGRLLKSAFPSATQYTYFRSGHHGFEDCIEIPAFTVYLANRERERSMELLVTATQCNVVLPQAFIGRIAHAVKRAEEEAQQGRLRWQERLTPNMDQNIAKSVFKSIGDTEGAKRAVEDFERGKAKEAAKAKGAPKSYAPKPPPPKASAPSGSAPSTASSSSKGAEAKPEPAYKAMPTSAKSTRASPSEKPQQAPQLKKKRTD